MANWWESSSHTSTLQVEICFLLADNFYIGDPNNHAQLNDPTFQIPLDMPNFPRYVHQMARSEEVVSYEDTLANYYLQIARLAKQHGQDFNTIGHYFWLRLCLWNTEEDVHIGFPWYDSMNEFGNFFAGLRQNKSGVIYSDMDQGWELNVWQGNNTFHFQQRDPDDNIEHVNICVAQDQIVPQLDVVEARTQKIITHLSEKLGADAWSAYVKEDVIFKV
jgi:hypothetical protein